MRHRFKDRDTLIRESVYACAREIGQTGIKTHCPQEMEPEYWGKIQIKGTSLEQEWCNGYALGRSDFMQQQENSDDQR